MAQPVAYVPATDFSNDEASSVSGRSTVRTANLDAEFSALKTTTDQIRTNLAILQRDDTKLRDGVVELHTLSASTLALINSSGWTKNAAGYAWLTSTAYIVGNFVTNAEDGYLCVIAHTSGTFATDLAAGRWVRISGVSYSKLASTASGSGAELVGIQDVGGKFTATNVEAALAEVFDQFATESDSKGAALVANTVQIVNNVATLRTLAPVNGRRMYTKGYASAGDGGHGYWRGVTGAANGTYTNNSATTLVMVGGNGSAAWLLEYTRSVLIEQLGAKGDGTTLDDAAFAVAATLPVDVILKNATSYFLSVGFAPVTGFGLVCFGRATLKLKTGVGGFNITDMGGTRTATDRCVISCVSVDNIRIRGVHFQTDGTKEVVLYPIRTSGGLSMHGIDIDDVSFQGFYVGVLLGINSAGSGAYRIRNATARACGATLGNTNFTGSGNGQLTLFELDNDLVGDVHSEPGYAENLRGYNLLHTGQHLTDYGQQTDIINLAGIGTNRKGPTIIGVYADGVGEVIDIFCSHAVIKGVRAKNVQASYVVKLLHGAQYNCIDIDAIESCALAVVGIFGSDATANLTAYNTIRIGSVKGVGTTTGSGTENAVVRFGGGTMSVAKHNTVRIENAVGDGVNLDYIIKDGTADTANANFVEVVKATGWAINFCSAPPGNVRVRSRDATRAMLTMSGTQTLTSTLNQLVSFNTATVDIHSETDTANNKVRCKIPGPKLVTAQIRVSGLNDADDVTLQLLKNGVVVAQTSENTADGVLVSTFMVSKPVYIGEDECGLAAADLTVKATFEGTGTAVIQATAFASFFEVIDLA